ncbi:TSCPD domain-containing protein [Salinibius halmophilus]|uniref:TSCPD domain-containing protein n=1 Tax=Salinibius halmophilus TaxID=1853216 RepID=UPI000E67560E|nr:NrdJb [Salinibius halmophilus]
MSVKKIDSKIVGFAVKKPGDAPVAAVEDTSNEPQKMHEDVERPEVLVGSTYKIKTPLSEHALYVTINDIILNEGTEHESRQPFEVFINSKNLEHFQWVVALTRVISAVFRKGGDVTFLAEELKAVFDPQGGYFKKGGKFMPSLVAEIGEAIEQHLKMIGIIEDDSLTAEQRQLIEDKRKEYEGKKSQTGEETSSNFPPDATLCNKCSNKSVIIMDGCRTCLNCGDSKCG